MVWSLQGSEWPRSTMFKAQTVMKQRKIKIFL